MMKYLRALLFWLSFVIVTTILFSYLCLIALYCRLFSRDTLSLRAHAVATLWGRWLIRLTPGWTSTLYGAEGLPRHGDRPVVIVANHQSAADIWALYLTGAQFRWLSKQEVFRLPMVGTAMNWAGYVPIKRGHKESHLDAMEASREWIKRGISMVFFPEGTRSRDGKLQNFKIGAFRLAMETGADILPVVILGTKDMMVKKSGFPHTAHLEIHVLPRMQAQPSETVDQYTKRVQGIMEYHLSTRHMVPELNKQVAAVPSST